MVDLFSVSDDFYDPAWHLEKFFQMREVLHRGGNWWYFWQCSEERKPRILKSGEQVWSDAAHKSTIWLPNNGSEINSPCEYVNNFWCHTYFGVHPTGRMGTPYQRAAKSLGAKSPNVVAVNCVFAEFDAKDFDEELKEIAERYKKFVRAGNNPSNFDASGSMAARQRGLRAAWTHIEELSIPPSYIVMSGGGFQTFYVLDETIMLANQKTLAFVDKLQKDFTTFAGSDDGAKDVVRVLRVAGTHNRKGYYENGPLLVYFAPNQHEGVSYSVSEIEAVINESQRTLFTTPTLPDQPADRASTTEPAPTQRNTGPSTQSTSPSHKKANIRKAQEALSNLSQERRDSYDGWLKVGMVLYHEFGGAEWALTAWDEWSQKSSKYQAGACEAKWPTFATNGTKIGLGSLIKWAKEDNGESLSAYEEIKLQIEILVANGATSEEVTIKIDQWTENATELSPVELSSICKILRFTCQVKAIDVTQWRRDISATQKARKKVHTPTDELIAKVAGDNIDVDLIAFERNDAGNADAVCAKWNHAFRHVEQWGWLYWTGTHWEHQSAEKVLFATVKVILRERITQALNANLDREALKSFYHACTPSTTRINHAITQLKMYPEWDRVPDDWDMHDHLLNVANGVLDLRTGELTKHNPDLMFTFCIQTAFNPYADVTLITSYLLDLGLSSKVIDYLQMAVGYTLTGETNEECLFYLFGPTRSGKGTFCSALISLLERPLAAEIDFNTLTGSKVQSADAQNFALAPLKPCRLVVASESSKYQALNEEKVKRITGGDQIHCAFKGKTHFNYRPKFKIWLASNHKPKADVDDDAIWGSRIKMISFPKSFLGSENKGLKKQMTQDPAYLEALLLWAVQGAYKWYQSPTGLVVPQEIKDATATARRELDYIQQWIDENLTVLNEEDIQIGANTQTSRGWTANNILYADYENWCHENGVSPKKARAFGRALAKKGYEKKRLRKPNRQRLYVRFGLIIDKANIL